MRASILQDKLLRESLNQNNGKLSTHNDFKA